MCRVVSRVVARCRRVSHAQIAVGIESLERELFGGDFGSE